MLSDGQGLDAGRGLLSSAGRWFPNADPLSCPMHVPVLKDDPLTPHAADLLWQQRGRVVAKTHSPRPLRLLQLPCCAMHHRAGHLEQALLAPSVILSPSSPRRCRMTANPSPETQEFSKGAAPNPSLPSKRQTSVPSPH